MPTHAYRTKVTRVRCMQIMNARLNLDCSVFQWRFFDFVFRDRLDQRPRLASLGDLKTFELQFNGEVAEPFRFNFEIAWEVVNKPS